MIEIGRKVYRRSDRINSMEEIRRVIVRHFGSRARVAIRINPSRFKENQCSKERRGRRRRWRRGRVPEDHFFADALCVITSSTPPRSPPGVAF